MDKKVLPQGEFHVRITQYSKGKSEKKGTTYIKLRFENQRGYIDQRFYFTEKSQTFLGKLFEACGLEKPSFDNLEKASMDLLKKELLINIVETFNAFSEKTYNDIDAFKKLK